jgi:hypothetical protein
MSAANEAEEGSKEKKGGVGGGYKFDVDMGGEAAPDAEAGDFFFTPDGSYPMDYFGESTRGDLLPHKDFMDAASILKPHDVKCVFFCSPFPSRPPARMPGPDPQPSPPCNSPSVPRPRQGEVRADVAVINSTFWRSLEMKRVWPTDVLWPPPGKSAKT